MYHRLDYFIASIYKTRHLLQNVNFLTWSHFESNWTLSPQPTLSHPRWIRMCNLTCYLGRNQHLHSLENCTYPLSNKYITIITEAFYRTQTKFAKVIFYRCLSVHRGACMAGGMHGRGRAWQGGHAWWGACMTGGMHGRGACMVGECVAGGMHDRGACMVGSMHGSGGVCGDMVNERAVRILLECILVLVRFLPAAMA